MCVIGVYLLPERRRYVFLSRSGFIRCLSFEVFDLQDDIWGYGSFLIKHGVGESGLGDGADFSGDSEREIVDGTDGVFIEDGFRSARQFQVVEDIGFGFLPTESGHVVADGDALAEGLHDGELHDSAEIGLTHEDEDKRVAGIHFEVGQQAEFFEGSGLEEMRLIDDQEDCFARLLSGFQESGLDLGVDGAFGYPGGQS